MENRKSQRTKIKCLVLGSADSGKTSILRRYFHNTFHSGPGVPTLGCDFYTTRIRNPYYIDGENKKNEVACSDGEDISPFSSSPHEDSLEQARYISLQMWDTPGRELVAIQQNHWNKKYYPALSDFFLCKVDAALLVYDITSSTSFTKLMKMHADLMKRMERIRRSNQSNNHNLPIVIVANKLDIFHKNRDRIMPTQRRCLSSVPRRDVIGLKGKFRGKDWPYEYRVSSSSPSQVAHFTRKNKQHRYEISTFISTLGTWTADGSYLNSLLLSEDGSHPDKDMVLLWCMRNKLKHVEVSALDGSGIHDAVDVLVRLTLESQIELESNEQEKERNYFDVQPNKELDLQELYAPDQNRCFNIPLINRCKELHSHDRCGSEAKGCFNLFFRPWCK